MVKIERGGGFLGGNDRILFEEPDGNHERFTRNGKIWKFEVGKCYEWKLGLGDPTIGQFFEDGSESLKAIASDTVREIDP